jgi:hypothetical protein
MATEAAWLEQQLQGTEKPFLALAGLLMEGLGSMKDRAGGYTSFSVTGLSGRNGPAGVSYLQ